MPIYEENGNTRITSTSEAGKGLIQFGSSAYDEANDRLGIGTDSPTYDVETTGTVAAACAMTPLVTGGVGVGDDLVLESTRDATKGLIKMGASAYDEVNDRLGVGTDAPKVPLEVVGDGAFSGEVEAGSLLAATLTGGSGEADDLTLASTEHGTKGLIKFGNSAYDEVNNRLGINTQSPSSALALGAGGDKTFAVERRSDAGTGRVLTIKAGGAKSGETDTNGGDLNLKSGQPTGSGVSVITLQTPDVGSTGTADSSFSAAVIADAAGSVICGKGQVAQGGSSGFLWIPIVAGAPNGTPLSYPGRVPITFEVSSGKLWVYDGTSWASFTKDT